MKIPIFLIKNKSATTKGFVFLWQLFVYPAKIYKFLEFSNKYIPQTLCSIEYYGYVFYKL